MKIVISLLLALFFTAPLHANLLVYPMSLEVQSGKQTISTLSVTSRSDTTQYVRISLKEVANPATDNEQERDVASWQGEGIVLSPMKFALPAGATKTIRIIALNKAAQEKVYRAYFEPVSGEQISTTSTSKAQAQVSLTLVWGVLIRQLPEKPLLALQRINDLPGVSNNGTVRMRIRGYSQCQPNQPDEKCDWKSVPQGIYPGQQLKLPGIKPALPLRIRYLTEDNHIQSLTLP